MKNVSNDYKNAIKTNGREKDVLITYNNNAIDRDKIYYVKYKSNGEILKTLMKEIDLEVKEDFNINDILNFKFGILVNGSFEYIDYGDFIVKDKEYKEDTKTYKYKLCDKMLLTMIPFVNYYTFPSTLYNFVSNLASTLGFTLKNSSLPNGTRTLSSNPFDGYDGITCRNVLDYVCEVVGMSAIITGNQIEFITPNDTNYTLTSDYLDETNVNFGETFGPINSVLFTRFEDSDYVEIKDDTSIAQYGKTQIKIKNNPILNNDDRVDYQQELFDEIKGLSYNLSDYQSKGITFLDFYDLYDVVRDNNTYHCLMLNDEITITTGIKETIYTDEPKEYEKEYKTQDINVDDVSAKVDKANKEIVLKVDSNGKLVQQRLGLDANGGSSFSVKADNIDLSGKVIDLTGDNIQISSTNFTVNSAGQVFANSFNSSNVNVSGGSIMLTRTTSTTPLQVYYYPNQSDYNNYYETFLKGDEIYLYHYNYGNVNSSSLKPNKIETEYLQATNIQRGTCTLYGTQDTTIYFTNMGRTPTIILTSRHNGTSNAYVGNVVATGNDYFTAYRSGGGSTGVDFNWIAIG